MSYWERDEVADWFKQKSANELLIQWIDQHGILLNGAFALDAGCGYGRNSRYIKDCGATVFAFDPSPRSIKHSVKYGLGRAVRASIQEMPFSDKVFDLIIADGVLHQFTIDDDLRKAFEYFDLVSCGKTYLFISVFIDGAEVTHLTERTDAVCENSERLPVRLLGSEQFMGFVDQSVWEQIESVENSFPLPSGVRRNLTLLLRKKI